MNRIRVELPFAGKFIEQSEGGQPVSEAAQFLQDVIIKNVDEIELKGLELGSGNGVISFMLALQRPSWELTGIEIQPELYDLALSNNSSLGLGCSFVLGDLREFRTLIPHAAYDLIYANPPWIKSGSGRLSPDPARALSRTELSAGMRDVLACIRWALKPQGTAWIIYPETRKAELSVELAGLDLEVRNLFNSEESPRSFVAKLGYKSKTELW